MAIVNVLCPVVVGRAEELSALQDALLRALRGEGGVVLLGGDAGMGKSRLARELEERAGRLSCAVMAGACSEAELALPYLPFLEAVLVPRPIAASATGLPAAPTSPWRPASSSRDSTSR